MGIPFLSDPEFPPVGQLVRKNAGYLLPKNGATALDQMGIVNLTATGTATLFNSTITTKYTRMRLMEHLVTVAATTAVAGIRVSSSNLLRGNAAGVGGFYFEMTWGPATGVATATHRAFAGLTVATTAPTDVQPSTLVDMIGMGWDAADTNIQLMHNDASGTATKVDLGASFPVPTADRTKVYRIRIWCAPNESKLNWEVCDCGTGAVVSGTTGASTDIPANTAYLSPRGYCSVGGTSSVVGFGFMGLYFEGEAT